MKFPLSRAIAASCVILITQLAGAPINDTLAAQEPDLRRGDIFVSGVEGSSPFWGYLGPRIIWRVRDGVKERYCQSSDELFFGIPEQMMVDSAGRIVFIAKVGPEVFAGPRALFRCDGSTVERLAYFPRDSAAPLGVPDPFPGKSFDRISGLHLATVQTIEITPDRQRLITEDAYVMAMEEFNPQTGAVTDRQVRRYRATTGEWDIAPGAAQWRDTMPAMVNFAGNTYSTAQSVLRRSTDPLRLEARGTIFDLDFDFGLAIFGGYKEVDGLLVDDSALENLDSGCDPNLPSPPSLKEPRSSQGTYGSMTDLHYDIEYDGYGSQGLVLRTTSGGGGSPYLTKVSEVLLNELPNDDIGEYFYRSTAGCAIYGSLKYTSILPFFDPVTGQSNQVKLGTMTASPLGLIGTSGDRLVRLVAGVGLETIDSGFVEPQSVAVYPAVVPPASGAVVIIQINSPVDVLVTDAGGNRIGVDPATGEAVNDFGQDGFDSGPGEPRFLGIKNPTPGAFDLETIGTGDGPFSIQVYSSALGQPQVALNRISVSGTASTGVAGEHDFTLAEDTTIAFVAPPPPLDSTAPVINAPADIIEEATSATGAVVTFNATATDDKDGPVIVAATPASGSTFPIGPTTIDLSASDQAGNTATAGFTVTVVDTIAPAVSVPGNMIAEATGAAGATVSYSTTATDAVGVRSTDSNPPSGSTFPLGTTLVKATARDAAGNLGSASFTITVVDTIAPLVTVPALLVMECAASGGVPSTNPAILAWLASATASDRVDPSPMVTHNAPAMCVLGTTTVTFISSDASGNTASASSTIRVVDTTAPTVTASLDNLRHGRGDDDDHGRRFVVRFTCDDGCSPGAVATATLNGIPVTNGQIVQLVKSKGRQEVQTVGRHVLKIKAPAFELAATCKDASGNQGRATMRPVFPTAPRR